MKTIKKLIITVITLTLLCLPTLSFAGTDYYQGVFKISHYCPCFKCCGKQPWQAGYQFPCPTIYNSEIHIVGNGNSSLVKNVHYKFNGTEWTSVSTVPYKCGKENCVVYNDELHIMGSKFAEYNKYHYKFNGTEWTSVSTLPYSFYSGSAVVYENEIHLLGSGVQHSKFNGTEWTSVSTLPYNFSQGFAAIYKNKIHIMSGYDINIRTKHYKLLIPYYSIL